MKKVLPYVAVALVAFTLFLVVYAPAGLAWILIRDDVRAALPELGVGRIEGTLWQGRATLQYREFPPANLDWTLAPLGLMGGTLDFDGQLTGSGLELDIEASGSDPSYGIGIEGHIDSSYINAATARAGVQFSGRLEIKGLDITTDSRWFTSAAGDLSWNGGMVQYPSPAGIQALTLPALTGNLAMEGADLQLGVQSGVNTVMGVTLQPTGWVLVESRARLLALAGWSLPPETDPDGILFRLEEQLFRGAPHGQ